MPLIIRSHRLYKITAITLLVGLIFFSAPTFPVAASANSADFSMAIIQVAKQNIPAVVHIEVTERQEVVNPYLPFENDPFFRHFFGATKLEVLLSNGERYPARLVGTDPKTDLAVIHIAAKDPLPHVTFGDSDRV